MACAFDYQEKAWQGMRLPRLPDACILSQRKASIKGKLKTSFHRNKAG
jgi:hypothetical protein